MRFRSIVALCLPVLLATPASAAKLVLSGADFHAAVEGDHYFLNSTASIEGQGGPGLGCLIASVDLPNGAILQNMRVRYLDADPTDDFSLDLKRKRLGNSVPAVTVTYLDTAGWNPGILEEDGSPVTLPLIDDAYSYYLSTDFNCLDSTGQRIYTVTFEYQQVIFADGFESGNTAAWASPPSLVRSQLLNGADFRGSHSGWYARFNPELGTFTQPVDGLANPIPCGFAPAELPHGATVNGIIGWVYDGRTDRGLTVELRRAPMASAVMSTVMAADSSSGNGGWQLVSDFSVGSAVVDNASYWYYLTACVTGGNSIGSNDILTQAVEIAYTLP